MTHEQFKNLLEELDDSGAKTLAEKNARYSSPDDALQNFHEGAEIMGCTTAQACWGYMTKHLSALRKMIWSNDFSNREDVKEKLQDTLNYLRFIWAISEEERNKCGETVKNGDDLEQVCDDGFPPCIECDHFKKEDKKSPCGFCKRNYTEEEEEYYIYPVIFQKHA